MWIFACAPFALGENRRRLRCARKCWQVVLVRHEQARFYVAAEGWTVTGSRYHSRLLPARVAPQGAPPECASRLQRQMLMILRHDLPASTQAICDDGKALWVQKIRELLLL